MDCCNSQLITVHGGYAFLRTCSSSMIFYSNDMYIWRHNFDCLCLSGFNVPNSLDAALLCVQHSIEAQRSLGHESICDTTHSIDFTWQCALLRVACMRAKFANSAQVFYSLDSWSLTWQTALAIAKQHSCIKFNAVARPLQNTLNSWNCMHFPETHTSITFVHSWFRNSNSIV